MTGALAFAGALCAVLLIRSQDFVRSQQSVTAGRAEPEGVLPAAGETGAGSSSPARLA